MGMSDDPDEITVRCIECHAAWNIDYDPVA
jgi:hypothetical protein